VRLVAARRHPRRDCSIREYSAGITGVPGSIAPGRDGNLSRPPAPKKCRARDTDGPMKTAQAEDAASPSVSSSCHRPPGVNDHWSSHGSSPARFRRSPIRRTNGLSRLLCERKTSKRRPSPLGAWVAGGSSNGTESGEPILQWQPRSKHACPHLQRNRPHGSRQSGRRSRSDPRRVGLLPLLDEAPQETIPRSRSASLCAESSGLSFRILVVT
jgi:hypothetical protein